MSKKDYDDMKFAIIWLENLAQVISIAGGNIPANMLWDYSLKDIAAILQRNNIFPIHIQTDIVSDIDDFYRKL